MPIDPITLSLVVGSFLAGAAVGYFWDDIVAWARRAIGYILDRINDAIEVTSKAIVYLVKQGRRTYKRVEVYARNIYSKANKLYSEQQEIPPSEIPEEIDEELDRKLKIKVAQQST